MKKVVAIIVFVLAAISSQAQDSLHICRQKAQIEDILTVLEAMNINLYRFDMSGFLKHKYDVAFYVEEYKDGENKGRLHTFHFGSNIVSLDGYTEEDREWLSRETGLSPDAREWNKLTSATVITKEIDDSTAFLSVALSKNDFMRCSLKRYPAGPHSVYLYSSRPFRLDPVADTDTLDIPLVLYGSGWYDERFDMIRFCGESEIDPEMKADILQNLPHYYVFGAELIRRDDDRK